MKTSWKKYVACLFLVTVFVMKGLLTVLPGLLTHTFDTASIEQLVDDESERNGTEEKLDKAEKVLYIDTHVQLVVPAINEMAQRTFINNHLLYKQSVYPSIPTPPPELS